MTDFVMLWHFELRNEIQERLNRMAVARKSLKNKGTNYTLAHQHMLEVYEACLGSIDRLEPELQQPAAADDSSKEK